MTTEMDDLVERLVESIAENEGWQGDLTDNERGVLLNSARKKLRAVIDAERVRLVDLFDRIGGALSSGEGSERANMFQRLIAYFGL